MPGIVHVLDPTTGAKLRRDAATRRCAYDRGVIEIRGPADDRGDHRRDGHGTNGILIPPDGYIQGIREICDQHGILLIADEMMSGFGRTGEWLAVNHWDVVPDMITMAKGLTSSYLPLGAVGMRPDDCRAIPRPTSSTAG